MPARTAQIVINVDDQSLVRLNQELKQLQDTANSISTSKTTVSTSSTTKISKEFTDIKTEAKKVQDVIEDLGGTGKDSIPNLAKETVKGFEKGTEAVGKTGKALKNVAKEGIDLSEVTRGLGHLMRVFGSEGKLNAEEISGGFRGIKDIAKGLAPIMAEALAPALIAAAVAGLIIVAIKWKDITRAVSEYVEKLKLTREIARDEAEIKAYDRVNKAIDDGNKLLEDRRKFFSLDQKTDRSIADAYEADISIQFGKQNEELQKQLDLRKLQLELNKLQFDKAERALQKVGSWGGVISKQDTERYKKALEQLRLIQLEGDAIEQESKNIQKQIQLNDEFINKRKDYAAWNSDLIAKSHEETENAKNQLTILQAQGDQERAIYENKVKLLREEEKTIGLNSDNFRKLNDEEKDRLAAIKTELSALKISYDYNVEERRIKEQLKKDDIERLKYLRDYNRELDNQKLYYSVVLDNLKQEQTILENQTKFFNDQVEQLTKEEDIYKKIVDARQAVANFDKIGLANEREAMKTFNERLAKNEDGVQAVQTGLETEVKNRKIIFGIGEKIYEQNKKNLAEELFYFTKIKEASNEKLENDKKVLEIRKQSLVVSKSEVEDQIKKNNQLEIQVAKQLEQAKVELSQIQEGKHWDEERKAATQKVVDLEVQLRKMDQENVDGKAKIVDLNGQIVSTDNEILGVNQQIYENTQGITDETEKTNAALKEQARAYKKLQNFVGKYGEEIAAVQDALNKSFEMLAAFQDRRAEIAQQRIDSANQQLDDLKNKEAENQDLLKGYEEELKDANGDRYDELLAKIDEAKQAQVSADDEVAQKEKEIAELERQRREAEYKAARWRKAQAIVEAVINTALAVIKALPNVFLSVASGIAGAAQVAIVSAQKLPPKDFAQGGFTGFGKDNEPAGTVHKGEYVVPAYVVRNPQAKYHLQALEGKRKGYADGGMVTPNISGYNSQFDYDKLISGLASAMAKVPPPQVGLVNISNGLNEVQLTKSQAGLNR